MSKKLFFIFVCCCILLLLSASGILFWLTKKETIAIGTTQSQKNNKIISDGFYIPGFTLGTYSKNIKSIEECEKLCTDNPDCQWFDYNKLGKYCYQKAGESVMDQLVPIPSEIGFKLSDGTYASYDRYYIGETLEDKSQNNLWEVANPIVGLTVEQCRNACNNNEKCMYYRYGYGTKPKECHMKELTENSMWMHGQIAKRTSTE